MSYTADTKIEQSLDYEDLALFEAITDEVFFQEFFLPSPGTQTLLSEYLWSPDDGRVVWYCQYPFVLWPVVVGECGRAMGKTTIAMQGGTMYDMVNLNNMQTAIAGPSEQHTMRVMNEVLALLLEHKVFSDWLGADARLTGSIKRTERRVRTRNGWELHGLIPGLRGGVGFKGEHPNRLRVDEVQDVSMDGMKYLDDAVRPFEPFTRKSKEQFFGVPDGDRSSRYYSMCHDDSGKWSPWVIRTPSYLAPTMRKEDFISNLQRTSCTFHQTSEGSIVVSAWSNDAKQNTLGQWGDPTFPCFPVHVYTAATLTGGTPHYHIIEVTDSQVTKTVSDPAVVMRQLLLNGPSRDTFGAVEKVYLGIDTGRELCPVLVWIKLPRSVGNHPAIYWLVERIDIKRVMDTTTLAKLVDAIADYWMAEWICIDSTSQAVFLADFLCDEAMFAHKGRFKLTETASGVTRNCREMEQIAKARGWKPQVVLPVNFASNIPIRFENNEPILANSNIFPVSLLQDMLQVSHPKLLLPPDYQDNAFYGQVTSYREVVGMSGRRYLPVNPHWVDAMRTFAIGLLYAELLQIDSIEMEEESSILVSNLKF